MHAYIFTYIHAYIHTYKNKYINFEVMTYVITLPVVSRGNFEFMTLNFISIALKNKEFLYIDAEESIPCLDQTRQ